MAIGEAIEEELGNRSGQRSDLSAIAHRLPKGPTVDIAAKRAGFKSAETYERAKVVVKHGDPGLVSAMDNGAITISAAVAIATQQKTGGPFVRRAPKVG